MFFVLLCSIFFATYKLLLGSLIQRIDHNLLIEVSEVETSINEEGIDQIKKTIQAEAREEGIKRIYFKLFAQDGQELACSDLNAWGYVPFADLQGWHGVLEGAHVGYDTVTSQNTALKARIVTASICEGKYILQIGALVDEAPRVMAHFKKVFLGAGFALLCCGTLLGWLLAQRAMNGVRRITQTALNIGADGFNHRVQLGNEGNEIDLLAVAFNNMLDRIELLMFELKDVTNNIAHDLRTPITRIRGLAETTVNGDCNIENYQQTIGIIVEEADGLIYLINTMLEIAELDAGLKKVEQGEVDLVDVVQQGYELFLPVAQDRGLTFTCEKRGDSILVQENKVQIQRVISNLIDNAIKYTNKGGRVDIFITKDDQWAYVSIKDTGIGISIDQQERIFEKFYRVETPRSTPGNGLGLSLAKAILVSLGGDITVESDIDKGSLFCVTIPLKKVFPAC